MKTLNEFLTEGKEGKSLHLEHIEDSILNDGVIGARDAINFLQSLRDMLAGHTATPHLNLTSKWDGAPAIFAGINPANGKFFVGSKSVFNKNPKLNYTPADIDRNHPGEGLNQKLKVALQYLPEIGITGVMQGDMMFTQSDLKYETIDGEQMVTFQPNTIVYAVPLNSTLAKQITSAKMGVVWHTEYKGSSLENTKASYNINIGKFRQSKNVWFRDATVVDLAGTATFTAKETAQITAILSQAGSLFKQIPGRVLNEIATNETYKLQIKTWNNSHVRSGQKVVNTGAHVSGLIGDINARYNKITDTLKKDESKQNKLREKEIVLRFYRQNAHSLRLIFDLQNLIIDAKNMIIRKLEQMENGFGMFVRDANGLKVVGPEGFVLTDIIKGKTVKLVDRLTFSHNNFNAAKDWK